MTETHLAAAVRAAVEQWMQSTTPARRGEDLARPATLGATLGLLAQGFIVSEGHDPSELRQALLRAPFNHLKGVFDVGALLDTPTSFNPVPLLDGTAAARAAALAVHAVLYMETISYGSENNGELFVNLVALSGQGVLVEKSTKSMRGHTDGVSFPFNGEDNQDNPRIAPSPDFVTLIGLRNPNDVATTVMPLDAILSRLSQRNIAELMKPQFSISSQKTFVQGMKRILGRELVCVDQPILKQVGDEIHGRYSHSKVVPSEVGGSAETASQALELACMQAVQPVVVRPGDLLLINNRRALHGRGAVSNEIGGQSRWLLRTYGLNTDGMPSLKRHLGAVPRHVLFP